MITQIQQVLMIEYRLQKENERRKAAQTSGNSYRATITRERSVASAGSLAALVQRLFVPADANRSSTQA